MAFFGITRSGKNLISKGGKPLAGRVDKYLDNWKVEKALRSQGLTNVEQKKVREFLSEKIGDRTSVSDLEIKNMLKRSPEMYKALKGESPTQAGNEILDKIDKVDGKDKFNDRKFGGLRHAQDKYAEKDLDNN